MNANAKSLSKDKLIESTKTFKRITPHNKVVFIPATQGIQKSINIISHINKPKEISHMSL